MSTRCQIQICDESEKSPGALLYHHSDGYPSFQGPKLERFLAAVAEGLTRAGHPYWWDSERVAAMLVMLSAEDYSDPLVPGKGKGKFKSPKYFGEPKRPKNRTNESIDKFYEQRRPNNGVPVYQPCLHFHGDIEYVWKVVLKHGCGEFELKCYAVKSWISPSDIDLEPVDWRVARIEALGNLLERQERRLAEVKDKKHRADIEEVIAETKQEIEEAKAAAGMV